MPLGFLSFFTSLARSFDVLTDPLMGWITDAAKFPPIAQLKARFGRRKPFMAIGSFAYALFFTLLYYPPSSIVSTEFQASSGARAGLLPCFRCRRQRAGFGGGLSGRGAYAREAAGSAAGCKCGGRQKRTQQYPMKGTELLLNSLYVGVFTTNCFAEAACVGGSLSFAGGCSRSGKSERASR